MGDRHNEKMRFRSTALPCRVLAWLSVVCIVTALATSAYGTTWYVSTNSPADGPGTDWSNAFHVIQSAIDRAAAGDVVFVTNGVYSSGGARRTDQGPMNRILVTKAIRIESVNGPDVTFIVGQGPIGNSASRCAYLSSNAVLSGFALLNGCSRTLAGGSLVVDSKSDGGGAYVNDFAELTNCTLTGNQAALTGGGVFGHIRDGAILRNCTLTGNVTGQDGGGAFGCALYNCTLAGNYWHDYGYQSSGGGANSCTLYNCTLVANTSQNGGGAAYSMLYNCTLVGNWAQYLGSGGTCNSTSTNCIVHYNNYGNNYNYEGTMSFCCTTPLPVGQGNTTSQPGFVDPGSGYGVDYVPGDLRLASNSVCINAGTILPWMTGAVDNWGNPRVMGPKVDIGAYEAGVSNPACRLAIRTDPTGQVVVVDAWTNAAPFDRLVPYGVHRISLPGTRTFGPQGWGIWMWSDGGAPMHYVNITHDRTLMATIAPQSVDTYYVAPSGTNTADGRSWAAAVQTIQRGIELALPGDTVLVTNGTYATGGVTNYPAGSLLTNRIAIYQPITVRSVNGPEFTSIVGQGPPGNGAARCAYIGAGATLCGFTLSNGNTRTSGNSTNECSGGGVWCVAGGVVSNCVLRGNAASSQGGGAFGGVLYNCVLAGNYASMGGGAVQGDLRNCTLTGNSATINSPYSSGGGGALVSTLCNCIVYYNEAKKVSSANWTGGALSFSCTTPLPPGMGNSTNAPGFVNAGSGSGTNHVFGDLHLRANSPCIDAGTDQAWMTGATDLAGGPRVVGTQVDVGAYEQALAGVDSDHDGLSDTREAFLGTDPLKPDTDGDGMKDGDEVLAGTCPTNLLDCLEIKDADVQDVTGGFVLWWDTVTGRYYGVYSLSDIAEFWSNVYQTAGDNTRQSYTNPPGNGLQRYFRLGVSTNAP